MIVALDSTSGRVLAGEGIAPFTCPHCGDSPLVVKRGLIVAAHFAHRPKSDCAESEPETAWHIAAKQAMAARLIGSELELRIGTCRADVASRSGRVAIEVQHSQITLREWRERTAELNRHGFAVLWVWAPTRLRWISSWWNDVKEPRTDGERWRLSAPMLAGEATGVLVYDSKQATLWKLLTRRAWPAKTIRYVRWREAAPGSTLHPRWVNDLQLASIYTKDDFE